MLFINKGLYTVDKTKKGFVQRFLLSVYEEKQNYTRNIKPKDLDKRTHFIIQSNWNLKIRAYIV